MMTLFRKLQLLLADHHGCGDCTMLAEWCTTTVQRPNKCRLNEYYAYCPITGVMPADYEESKRMMSYMFVDEEVSEDEG